MNKLDEMRLRAAQRLTGENSAMAINLAVSFQVAFDAGATAMAELFAGGPSYCCENGKALGVRVCDRCLESMIQPK
jgi:hypothetical protein